MMPTTTTGTITETQNHPDPYATIPGHIIRYASNSSTLPLPVPNATPRSRLTISASLFRRTNLKRCLKLFLASTVGVLGLIATWWALDLAMWTAVKEFRDDCRNSLLAHYPISDECEKQLSMELDTPRTWRSFKSLAGAAKRDLGKRWELDDGAGPVPGGRWRWWGGWGGRPAYSSIKSEDGLDEEFEEWKRRLSVKGTDADAKMRQAKGRVALDGGGQREGSGLAEWVEELPGSSKFLLPTETTKRDEVEGSTMAAVPKTTFPPLAWRVTKVTRTDRATSVSAIKYQRRIPCPCPHDVDHEVAREGIRKQGDAAIMYGGGMEYDSCLGPSDERCYCTGMYNDEEEGGGGFSNESSVDFAPRTPAYCHHFYSHPLLPLDGAEPAAIADASLAAKFGEKGLQWLACSVVILAVLYSMYVACRSCEEEEEEEEEKKKSSGTRREQKQKEKLS